MISTDHLDAYFALIEERPSLFARSELYPIVTDRNVIEEFVARTGMQIGVLYKSDYNIWVVDLIRDRNGQCYTYERVLPCADGRGVVCVPVCNGNYILLKQYRHAIRSTQVCFPRGYGEAGMSSADNAIKELREEIGATVKSVKKLGQIVADSGLLSVLTDVYLCDITSYDETKHNEGIVDIFPYTYDALAQMIARGDITDSFTLSAFALLSAVSFN